MLLAFAGGIASVGAVTVLTGFAAALVASALGLPAERRRPVHQHFC